MYIPVYTYKYIYILLDFDKHIVYRLLIIDTVLNMKILHSGSKAQNKGVSKSWFVGSWRICELRALFLVSRQDKGPVQ